MSESGIGRVQFPIAKVPRCPVNVPIGRVHVQRRVAGPWYGMEVLRRVDLDSDDGSSTKSNSATSCRMVEPAAGRPRCRRMVVWKDRRLTAGLSRQGLFRLSAPVGLCQVAERVGGVRPLSQLSLTRPRSASTQWGRPCSQVRHLQDTTGRALLQSPPILRASDRCDA